jgi:nucleotide-binding universal stress UspA family protein
LRGDIKKEALAKIHASNAGLVVVGRSNLDRMTNTGEYLMHSLNLPVMIV